MASAVYTSSQEASALAHLDRRDEWRFFWRDGVRYVSMLSGRTNRLYVVRADAGACSCPYNEKMWLHCSHMRALELDALEADLIESRDDQDAAIDLAFVELATRKRGPHAGAALIRTYDELWPSDD